MYRYNVYYVFRDDEGTWRGADGAKLKLPISKAEADKHARLFDSGHQFTRHKRVVIDAANRPYLRFTVGVEDWKKNKVIVPHLPKYAWKGREGWRVDDVIPDGWDEAIKRQIAMPGPQAYAKTFPNPWTIHYEMGPKGDRAKTYLWLVHDTKGYAARKGGPAPQP